MPIRPAEQPGTRIPIGMGGLQIELQLIALSSCYWLSGQWNSRGPNPIGVGPTDSITLYIYSARFFQLIYLGGPFYLIQLNYLMGPRRDEYQSDKSKDKRDRNTNKRLFNYEIIKLSVFHNKYNDRRAFQSINTFVFLLLYAFFPLFLMLLFE